MLVGAALWPPVPQDAAYHLMADERPILGVSNSFNVLSNVPFAIVGLAGLAAVFRRSEDRSPRWHDPWERWPYAALFAGTALTALGSVFYHLAPDNARLVWDRLPMTIGFMGLLTAIIAERVGLALARRLLIPLLVLGAASVLYWYWTELEGAGDLRAYGLVQFGSLLVIVLLLLLHPPRYSGAKYLWAALLAYLAAKVFELADRPIFAVGQIVSGHTLKHLAAAGALALIVIMLSVRSRR